MMLFKRHLYDLQALLCTALCSCETVVAPYPTAQNLGEQPLSKEQFPKLRRDTPQPGAQVAASRHSIKEVTSSCPAPHHTSHVLQHDLVLTLKLSRTVFYGR